MTDHEGSPALTGNDHPATSHWAAEKTNTTKMEILVLNTLDTLGSLTSEEIANFVDLPVSRITPRMAALMERFIIRQKLWFNGHGITRKGASGCERIVYEINPRTEDWLDKRPVKLNRAQKIRELEAEIERLNTIIEDYQNADKGHNETMELGL
jgi:DNA-binding Lrp family transcriptional regulator